MTQYSMTKALNCLAQMGWMLFFRGLNNYMIEMSSNLFMQKHSVSEDICNTLPYLMFLKHKRTGKIKSRGCTDRRKQQEDSSSPTVSIKSVMLTCTIDAHEKRYVATVDIPVEFMQADMDDTVYMKMEGIMADLLMRLDADHYKDFVVMGGNKKVLYLQLKKTLYGTLKAALLFWKWLSNVLLSWGFIINPYNHCVANKDMEGTQCAIIWHVDDLKISHVKASVVDKIISMLSKAFGNEAPLTSNRGKIHYYLGMTLDYSNEGKVNIIMSDYITNVLEGVLGDMDGVSPTPAANHLFEVNKNPAPLDKKLAKFVHHVFAQVLFLCKRTRPNIQTAISFLCTQVNQPDADDYKKLSRVIQ
jgi:Reverse transcriptase (RNA-dependent DNA polymerase)